jgi:integrase
VKTVSKPGRHSDGGGLYLNVTDTGARSWLFMWKTDGRRREMGLGSALSVSLADARELSAWCRSEVAHGRDPLETRATARAAKKAVPTFGQCADEFVATKCRQWRSAKHAAQWTMTLVRYAAPLRSMPVNEIDTAAVLSVLQGVWKTRFETAYRLRGRIEAVLDAAKAKGHRSGENPARWRGHLDNLLPSRQKLSRGHHAAMPYSHVPHFIARLREQQAVSMAALALEFIILTAARLGEALDANWSEIDLVAEVWIVPAPRMKAGREHRVPLSMRVLAILTEAQKARTTGDYLFPGRRPCRGVSGMATETLVRRLALGKATVHGFRSSFRDWTADQTDFPREVAEAALAHVVGDAAEQAYRRGDALEKRRALMEAWANFCDQETESNIVSLAARKIG